VKLETASRFTEKIDNGDGTVEINNGALIVTGIP
jgi:hypothetical protein